MVDGSYYRAMVLPSATATSIPFSIDRVGADGSVTTLASTSLNAALFAKDIQFRVNLEVSGGQTPTLRARVFPAAQAAPDWQLTASDTSPQKITKAGGIGVWAYTSSSSTLSKMRVFSLDVRADGLAEASGFGAPTLGTTSYPVPADATKVIWVDPSVAATADDWKPGEYMIDATHRSPCTISNRKPTLKLPLGPNRTVRTLGNAIKQANDGDTIILKGGTYHEQLTVCEEKALTIQPENGAKVWLDGSVIVPAWSANGGAWSTPWKTVFDKSPTYEWGKPDGTTSGWQFVNPQYPMAAHPDQVMIDGVSLTQVQSRADVGAGTFFLDEASGKLYLGSDPAGHEVRVSDLQFAIIAGTPVKIQGIGVRNYATSVPQQASVFFQGDPSQSTTAYFRTSSLTDVILENNAVGGALASRSDSAFTNVTARYNGLIGLAGSGNVANLTFDNVSANRNNVENFNQSPTAAGLKVSKVTGLVIKNSEASENNASGLWLDELTTSFALVGNQTHANQGSGNMIELASNGYVINSYGADNTDVGLQLLDTSFTQVWNNTFTGGNWGILVKGDGRLFGPKGSEKAYYSVGNVLHNNLVGGTAKANSEFCNVVCVFDETSTYRPKEIVEMDGNVYHRESLTAPSYLVRWDAKAVRVQYSTLTAFRTATGYETHGHEVTGALPVNANGTATSALTPLMSAAGGLGTPIPATIAALTAGTRFPLTAGAYTVGVVRP
jgi:hypothetical protein